MEAGNIFDGLVDEELPLDCIESPFYEQMRSQFNIKLCELLCELDSGKFEEGDITLKLNMSIMHASDEIAEQDMDTGGEAKKFVGYLRPYPEWDIKVNLKHSFKEKGCSQEKRSFIFRDGRFIAAPIPSAQVSFDELQGRRV